MKDLSRRSFLGQTAFAALATALGGCRSWSSDGGFAINGIRIGVQLDGVADFWKENPADTLRRLKAMGYDGVQSRALYDMNWDELEKMLDGEGLRIVGVPFDSKDAAAAEFEKFLTFCRRFDVDFAFMPSVTRKSWAEWKKFAEELLAVRGRLAAQGIRLGYHHQQHELTEKLDGMTPFQCLADSGLDFELDVGHAKLAGIDPVGLIGRLQGRVPYVCARPAGGNALGGPGDANNWRAIFNAAAVGGTQWAVVACDKRPATLEDVEKSMAYLKGLVSVTVDAVKSTVDVNSWEFKRRSGTTGGGLF